MKKYSIFRRSWARNYIRNNKEVRKWHESLIGKGDKKKRIRKGFRIGTIEDLHDQAKYGGIRLPGHFTIKHGEKWLYPQYDMYTTRIITKRSRIRIGHQIFSLDKDIDKKKVHSAEKLKLNRLWRFDDMIEQPAYIMYEPGILGRLKNSFLMSSVASVPIQTLIMKKTS